MRDFWKTLLAVVTFAALMSLLTATARAEDDPPPLFTPDPPPIDQRLEKENAELRAKLAELQKKLKEATTPQLWTVNGKDWATESELRRLHPGVRFPHDPPAVVPGVAIGDPFVQTAGCDAAGCRITPDTIVRTAGTLPPVPGLNQGPARSGALTYTLVPGAARVGITSGCATGGCAATTTYTGRRR